MISREFQAYLKDLSAKLDRAPDRPERGTLLARAMQIPLAWPEEEYPPGRSEADQFIEGVKGSRAVPFAVDTEAEALAAVAGIIREAGATRVSRWRSERLDRLDWERGLGIDGLEWIQTDPGALGEGSGEAARREQIARLERIEVGIIDADLAVAHTGTLALAHTPERDGLTNLFPWHCVAIVWASQLVPTLQDAIERIAEDYRDSRLPPSLVLLTGPSRSGDISFEHGQGAAGPGMQYVILIRD